MKKINSVCIIDDDSIYVYIVKRLMDECNFCNSIIEFENGKEGIEGIINLNATKNLPNIIFLDLSMPIMSGWEFLDSFAKATISNKEDIKIIVMSSSINPNEIEMIKAYPMVTDYIVKPITPSDLEKIASY
ncbi:response regulator receiver domain-containing protein [Maribacter vaceletii]|uniref:Response regulator receiver domain-containing protein n=1 Tax=Maribacter vaceletii TaxID=1206816 RepID=A0A495EDQ1_9FLAO|nr:response regulator [Maribacter vaceletii]RKR15018.1 response regulator receiver domain-containing protein [Maribacter vaceletii]